VVFLLYGTIKCNELASWFPGLEARRVRHAITIGADWTQALLAADRKLSRGRRLSATCHLARGGAVYLFRMGSGYMIHSCPYPDRACYLPAGISTYRTALEWEVGLRDQLLKPGLCQSLVVSVERDHEFTVALDSLGRVTRVSP
jgi:hypothetical protein